MVNETGPGYVVLQDGQVIKASKLGCNMITMDITALLMEKRLNEYVAMVQKKMNAYWERHGFTFAPPDTITVEMGRKNAKVVKVSDEGHSKSVHTFVNMETGDILKAGSWKAPAPNGVRGNIFAEDRGASVVNEHGAN
jgi:hypothetical protein